MSKEILQVIAAIALLGVVFGAMVAALTSAPPLRGVVRAGALFGGILALVAYVGHRVEAIFGPMDYLVLLAPPTLLTLGVTGWFLGGRDRKRIHVAVVVCLTWTVLATLSYMAWPSVLNLL